MARFHIAPQTAPLAPISFVLARQALQADAARRADRIEATMRRHEMPSVVDIAKRPDTLDQLSRILHL